MLFKMLLNITQTEQQRSNGQHIAGYNMFKICEFALCNKKSQQFYPTGHTH